MILRKLYKTLIYRAISIIMIFMIVYFITYDFTETTAITIIIEIVKTIQYFVFDCLWKKKSDKNE